jgi:hypothetical protein
MKIATLILLALPAAITIEVQTVFVIVRNESERECSVSWVNPQDGVRAPLFRVADEAGHSITSYEGHTFEIKESGDCEESSSCLVTMFTVGKEAREQSFVVDTNFQVLEASKWNKTTESLNDRLMRCRNQAKTKLQMVDSSSREQSRNQIAQDYGVCVKKGLASTLRMGNAEVAFAQTVTQSTASGMENFTCSDPNRGSSPDVETRAWRSEKDGKTRAVRVKLERPTSRIHVIEEFAYQEECDAMQDAAKDILHQAATGDGKGGSQLSDHRKAMQASINPAWSQENDGDLIARISRRVYDYVNYALDMNIDEHGQEPLMSIQYFGRGHNDTTPDRYMPHCDGPCEGDPFVSGLRMATVVIYCDVPEVGGHTNFQNANVHVKPEARSAVFFSYFDPKTNTTDKQ